MLRVEETYPHEIKMGDKIVKYRPWKTKDEKAYLILTESKESVDDNDLYETLVRPCIENKDMYLSDSEVQKLIIEIRKVSLGETFNVTYICKNESCKTVNEVDVNFDNIVEFKGETINSIKISDKLEVFFTDIKNSKVLKEKTEGKPSIEQLFIELVMRIDKIIVDGQIEDSFTFDEIYEYIDNISTKEFDSLLSYYTDNTSSIKMEGTLYCIKCNHANEFIFDELPNFLAGW